MPLSQLITEYGKVGLVALILGSGLIQISPIKINPWSWLFNKITSFFNKDLKERLTKISEDSEKEFDIINSNMKKLEDSLLKITSNFDYTKAQLDGLKERIDTIETTTKNIIDSSELAKVEEARKNILVFDSEIRRKVKFTQEYWNETLRFIDIYEDYCDSHPHYSNTKAVSAIANVKRTYDQCLQNNDFL